MKDTRHRCRQALALTLIATLGVSAIADDCEVSDACDVGSLMQKPISATAPMVMADAEKVSTITVTESLPDRMLAAWLEVARMAHLGRRRLFKIQEPKDAPAQGDVNLLQTVEQIRDHNPTDLMWMTVIPSIIIGLAITGFVGSALIYSGGDEEATKPRSQEATGDKKKSTMLQTTVNMVQNIVGEGMLSLPAGIAGGTGLLMGSLIATFFCALMGYTFAIMGRTCYATGEKNHKDCAAAVSGPVLAQTMAVICSLKTVFTCLTYAIVIGESFSRIAQFFGMAGFLATSQGALAVITLFIIIPLVVQKDLSGLAKTSLIGVFGEIWVVLAMQIRYMDGSYREGGQFYDSLDKEFKPEFEEGGVIYWKTSAATFVLLGSFATAFIAHYNAPKFYSELEDATPEKFNKVVTFAFGLAMLMYFWIMSVGYLTFGENSSGLILNNYSEKDSIITAARIAMGFAVTFGFPLGFCGMRDNFMSATNMGEDMFYPVTSVQLTIIITGAFFFHDLGLANSLGGAIFGAMITLIFPGLLMWCAGRTQGIVEFGAFEKSFGSFIVLALGFSLMVFGSTLVVLVKFFPEVIGK